MDKNAIKKYAVWARNELIARVTQKAEQYEITEKKTTPAEADSISGRLLSEAEKKQRAALIEKIKTDGFEQVMEEVAYTWFNRFTALRFMEVNNYLPSHTRVFTNEAGEFKPQILTDAIQLDLEGLNMDKVYELKDANKTEELYKYLLITQCNALSSVLPRMFQKISDYTELLLPDYLLREGSIIEQMISMIPEDNFNTETENGQVEIIGWLYQYYVSEKHEEIIDLSHGKIINKDEVPAATQLFTTDWVVRYLVDNTIGRFWIERNKDSKISEQLKYFVKPNSGSITHIDDSITPQELTVLDPCVGSGHFLVYAFDVLMKIYIERGYTEREAASEIIKNNIFGLDIDERAVQLAYFAIMMKARQYDRRFLSRDVQPHIFAIKESNGIDSNVREYYCKGSDVIKKEADKLISMFKDAREYGSIIRLDSIDVNILRERMVEIDDEIDLRRSFTQETLGPLIDVLEVMSRKFCVVATNPPYLNKYSPLLKDYISKNYASYKGDLFSVFIYKDLEFCKKDGYVGFLTPLVWLSLKSYEKLREYILSEKAITTLIQFEYSAFEEATVPICSFVLRNGEEKAKGCYFQLSEFKGGMEVQREKVEYAIMDRQCGYYFENNGSAFKKIPGSPIAFWINQNIIATFENGKSLSQIGQTTKGIITGNNDKYLRLWWEVKTEDLNLSATDDDDAFASGKKWFPCCKGGSFRKWYGNKENIINWQNRGHDVLKLATQENRHSQDYYTNLKFQKGISWSSITSDKTSFRFESNNLVEHIGMSVFPNDKELVYPLLGFLNSNVTMEYLKFLSPTITINAGEIGKLPILKELAGNTEVIDIVDSCISIAKEDWDDFEISWDFARHPLVPRNKGSWRIADLFDEWNEKTNKRFEALKSNEERLNKIIISLYGLEDEVSQTVEDKDVSVRKADVGRDIRSLLSYAVGCMFGRYSLDIDGLIYTGSNWDPQKYVSFIPDDDSIIPIADDEYFDDDIVNRFVVFIKTIYGEEYLEENLSFISNALGSKGSAREGIRNYFVNEFYADHVKIYQKRPIYWLFDSGKKNGFKCLIYAHRYQQDTIARIRTDYVHEQQSRYRTAIEDLEQRVNGAATSDRVKLNKRLATLKMQSEEIREYEERIHHLADQMIQINLDDGVKDNYAKFQDVLAKIK